MPPRFRRPSAVHRIRRRWAVMPWGRFTCENKEPCPDQSCQSNRMCEHDLPGGLPDPSRRAGRPVCPGGRCVAAVARCSPLRHCCPGRRGSPAPRRTPTPRQTGLVVPMGRPVHGTAVDPLNQVVARLPAGAFSTGTVQIALGTRPIVVRPGRARTSAARLAASPTPISPPASIVSRRLVQRRLEAVGTATEGRLARPRGPDHDDDPSGCDGEVMSKSRSGSHLDPDPPRVRNR